MICLICIVYSFYCQPCQFLKKTLGQFENLVLVIMSIKENSCLIGRTPFCLKQVALSPLVTVPIFLRIQVLLFFHEFIVISGKKTYNRLTRCY